MGPSYAETTKAQKYVYLCYNEENIKMEKTSTKIQTRYFAVEAAYDLTVADLKNKALWAVLCV